MRALELGEGASAAVATRGPARALNILLVADSLDAGGAERHVVGLAASLVRAGHRVTIGCSTDGVLMEVARHHEVRVRPLLASRAKRQLSLPFARQLQRLIASDPFDVVHAHMYASAAAAALATIGTSTPLVLTEHSEAAWRGKRARVLSRFIYWRAERIIAVSDAIRRRLIQADRVPSGRLTLIPNALPALDDPSAAATTRALPPTLAGRSLVGVAARLQPEKGIRYLLEAAVSVGSDLPNAAFVIIGDGPQRAQLEHFARRLGIGDRCYFLGFRADARAIIRQLDILAVPSLSEGTPLVVLEAMAAGVPIVASAVGGIPEQVRHGQEGLLVPPADAPALAAGLSELLRNPVRAHTLGENGRRRVQDCFSAETMLRDTSCVYQALVHPGRGAL